jgi:hypothetical protein
METNQRQNVSSSPPPVFFPAKENVMELQEDEVTMEMRMTRLKCSHETRRLKQKRHVPDKKIFYMTSSLRHYPLQ